MKKWFFALLAVCIMLSPISVLAEGNETSETNGEVNVQSTAAPLVISPEVTAFSDFTVSPNMHSLSGDITLNGNVPDAENKMRPVYKFTLENNHSEPVSGLTAYIPFPPNTTLDMSYPPVVLITETNQNRNKEDIGLIYDETDGIHLTLPTMEPGEKLTFDVKFFLLPLEEDNQDEVIDLNKVTVKPAAEVVESFKDHAKVKLLLAMNNANSMMMEKVTLKIKLPENLSINEAMISGIEGAAVTINDGYAIIYLPKLSTGDTNIVLHFNMIKSNGWDKLQLPLMISMDGMTEASLSPLSITLKDLPVIDWTKIMAAGDFLAEMKKDKLYLNYMLNLDNKNSAAAKSYKLRLLLPASVTVENLKVTGIEGAVIEMDKDGVIWIMLPSLQSGMSKLNVSLTGTYSGSSDELSTDIITEGADGITASLSAKIKGMSSTDDDSIEVITDTEKPTNASGNTLPKTGSPFSQLTWTMFGTLFVLLGIGLYVKAARMQA